MKCANFIHPAEICERRHDLKQKDKRWRFLADSKGNPFTTRCAPERPPPGFKEAI